MHSIGPIAALLLTLPPGAPTADDVSMSAMKDELARTMARLRLQEMERPYFVSYRLDDVDALSLSAELGSLTSERPERTRRVTVELRVGDRTLDNGNWFSSSRYGSGIAEIGWAPIDDDYRNLRRALWRATDTLYKRALEDLSAKREVLRSRGGGDALPDFTEEPASVSTEPVLRACPPRAEMEALVRDLSAVFRGSPEIRASSARLSCRDVRARFVDSEGSSFARPDPRLELEVRAESRGPAGRVVADSFEILGRGGSDLPAREKLLSRARTLLARVLALRTAPTLDRYTGPVLFEGAAAAEVFAEQLAPGFVAFRQPVSDDPRFEGAFERFLAQVGGGSFADKIGTTLLPAFLSVSDEPGKRDFRGTPLLAGRRVDDEGVATRATKLVERGRLKALLSTRIPSRSAAKSTGSRRGPTAAPSNLIVTAEKALSRDRLRKELLRRARERGLDHALVIRRVGPVAASPLLRFASRAAGQGEAGAASVLQEAYRITADGREELLQGLELADLSVSSFKGIVAVGDAPEVHSLAFLGSAASMPFLSSGAHDGDPPLVSFVVPALLFEELALVKSRAPIPDAPVAPFPLAVR